jgi:hypothetical protein
VVLGAAGGALLAAPLFVGEELGWRGYLQVRWYAHRPLVAAVLTGLVWGVFHYPLILVGFEGYEDVRLGLAVFPVFTVLQSILQGWLRRRSETLWTSCLAHAAANLLGGALTAYLFLGGGHFQLTGYAGGLAWLPLGAVSAGVVLTGRLAPPARAPEAPEAPGPARALRGFSRGAVRGA